MFQMKGMLINKLFHISFGEKEIENICRLHTGLPRNIVSTQQLKSEDWLLAAHQPEMFIDIPILFLTIRFHELQQSFMQCAYTVA